MSILITRPMEDALLLADTLAGEGFAVLIDPVLEIHYERDPVIETGNLQAVLVSSANGVRALSRLACFDAVRALACFTVGDSSARAAREAGFAHVEAASGDVSALVDLVAGRLDPLGGALFHGSGSVVAGDLKGMLEGRGFALHQVVLYHAQVAQAFSAKTIAGFEQGMITAVLLYSPRSAKIFSDLIGAHQLQDALSGVDLFCLSPAVRAALDSLNCRASYVPDAPQQDKLLDLVRAYYKTRA